MDSELVRLLAQTDALWRPIRTWRRPFPAVVAERREQYRRAGIPATHVSGADDADRQRRSRELRRLEATGFVQFGGQRGQRSHWRLTNAGDWKLRAAVGLPGYSEAMLAYEAIRKLEAIRHEPDDNVCGEHWLCGGLWGPRTVNGRMEKLEVVLAPLLCRGYVDAWSDSKGCVAYTTTRGAQSPIEPTDLPDFDDSLAELYDEALHDADDALQVAQPSNKTLCVIPLSAGTWPPIPKAVAKITKPLHRMLKDLP